MQTLSSSSSSLSSSYPDHYHHNLYSCWLYMLPHWLGCVHKLLRTSKIDSHLQLLINLHCKSLSAVISAFISHWQMVQRIKTETTAFGTCCFLFGFFCLQSGMFVSLTTHLPIWKGPGGKGELILPIVRVSIAVKICLTFRICYG